MTHYAVASHVFVCLQDEHVVFLDVRSDRYFSLEAARTSALGKLVRGWPIPAPATGAAEDTSASELLSMLMERGLLTNETRIGKDATPVSWETPGTEIYADAWDATPHIGPRRLSAFLAAAISASLTLRFVSFERMIEQARQRRTRTEQALARSGRSPTTFDRESARRLVSVFTALRPYFFTAKDACLFEALALGRFLDSFGIQSHWVFGVQTRPFAAHCWLQQDGVVFNDTVEHITRYTPIMVV